MARTKQLNVKRPPPKKSKAKAFRKLKVGGSSGGLGTPLPADIRVAPDHSPPVIHPPRGRSPSPSPSESDSSSASGDEELVSRSMSSSETEGSSDEETTTVPIDEDFQEEEMVDVNVEAAPAPEPKEKDTFATKATPSSNDEWEIMEVPSTRRKSKVWGEMDMVRNKKGVIKCRCRHCKFLLDGDIHKNGTSGLTRHLLVCKVRPRGADGRPPAPGMTQTLLSFKPGSQGSGNSLWQFNPKEARRKLACMIIRDEMPFRAVEGVGFRDYSAELNPRFTVPSRQTVKRDVMAIYADEKAKLLAYFEKARPRVCVTTDLWTSIQQISYMAVTAHFIDEEWRLVKKLIGFSPIDGHRGQDIHLKMMRILKMWKLDKLLTVTVDNASSNDLALDALMLEYGSSRSGVLLGVHMHMRCAAHIANLICQDGLKLTDESDAVMKIRDAVRYVRSSPKRIEKFRTCVGTEEGSRGGLELTLDVKTRWNSTYMMLRAALRHVDAWKKYECEEEHFARDMSERGERLGVPTTSDWAFAQKLCDFLECFYDFTLKVSGSQYVTANDFYSQILSLHQHLVRWIESDDTSLRDAATKMKIKFDKYWGQSRYDPLEPEKKKINLLLFVATVLDPRYKMIVLDVTLHYVYSEPELSDIKMDIKNVLQMLYGHYQDEHRPSASARDTTSTPTPRGTSTSTTLRPTNFALEALARIDDESGIGAKSDLDMYLEEPRFRPTATFDILSWWKMNAPRFPILSRMARDVLAIPVSTVSSEAAFSGGGRVLDAFRSSLATTTVEALLCCQDWIKGFSLQVQEFEDDLSFDPVHVIDQASQTQTQTEHAASHSPFAQAQAPRDSSSTPTPISERREHPKRRGKELMTEEPKKKQKKRSGRPGGVFIREPTRD